MLVALAPGFVGKALEEVMLGRRESAGPVWLQGRRRTQVHRLGYTVT